MLWVMWASVGDLIWDKNVPTRNVISMTVGDFDGDGHKNDIAVGTSFSDYAKVYAYRGTDGTLLWQNDETSPDGNLTGAVISMDTVPDVDGDGKEDVVVVTYKSGETPAVGVLGSSTGKFVWKKDTPNGCKINVVKTVKRNDGYYQVVIGTTNYSSGAEVFAYNVTDGSTPSGWTDYNAAGSVYAFDFGSFGDTDGVLVMGRTTSTEIRVIDATSGSGIDTDGAPKASVKFVKLSDVDEDGQNELIATSQDDDAENVFFYELSGGSLNPPVSADLSSNGTANCADITLDVNSDGKKEVVVGTQGKVWLLSGSDFSVIGSYDVLKDVNSVAYIGNSYVVAVTEGAGSGGYELWIFSVGSSGFSLVNKFDLLDNTSDGINKVVALDADEDGYLDFALISDCDGSINEVQVRKGYVPSNTPPVLSWVGGTFHEGVRKTDLYKTNGSLRLFEVNYTDPEGDVSSLSKVGVDSDRDGSYSSSETFNMTNLTDDFTKNVTFSAYVLTKLTPDKSFWYYNGTEWIANTTYRFFFKDSAGNDATGEPTSDHYIYFTLGGFSLNPVETTGAYANYVEPDSGYSGSTFTFRVSFFGEAGLLPDNITLRIDMDCDTVADPGETFTMTLESQNYDSLTGWVYANYTANVAVSCTVPFTTSTNITFSVTAYIFDSHTVSSNTAVGNITLYPNNLPTVEFVSIDPQSGADGDSFSFTVNYTDADDQAPSWVELWIDMNDNGAKDSGELFNMTALDPSDTNYTDGALYSYSTVLSSAGDGNLTVSVRASDSVGGISAEAVSWVYVAPPVSGNRPYLSFASDCPEGVSPLAGYAGITRTFRVVYRDPDGTAPQTVQLWIDLNDDGIYQKGEKFSLKKVAGDVKSGALYSLALKVDYAGDGKIKYKFYALDPYDGTAEGEPAFNRELVVLRPLKGDLEVDVVANMVSDDSQVEVHLPERTLIKIYDLKGREVFSATFDGEFVWDGRTSSGFRLPKGVYLLYLKSLSSGRYALVPVKIVR